MSFYRNCWQLPVNIFVPWGRWTKFCSPLLCFSFYPRQISEKHSETKLCSFVSRVLIRAFCLNVISSLFCETNETKWFHKPTFRTRISQHEHVSWLLCRWLQELKCDWLVLVSLKNFWVSVYTFLTKEKSFWLRKHFWIYGKLFINHWWKDVCNIRNQMSTTFASSKKWK